MIEKKATVFNYRDMTLYIENLNDPQKEKLLKLINKFGKVSVYKIKTLVYFYILAIIQNLNY